jgi:triphosphoribosyl-dephospho-CoA synthase
VSARAARIAAAFEWACLLEIEAPKPGNVHVFAAGHRMTTAEFARSAKAAAGPLSAPGRRVGARILDAVEATFAAVGANTNLGILLLAAPLAAAAELATADLRAAVAQILKGLDVEDARLAFRAIVRAAPAGLGHSARHDVFAPATVNLLQAMAESANRDSIARQYATDFADVFDLGLPVFAAAVERKLAAKWAALATYLSFLAAFADSHIVRKQGTTVAEDVRRKAAVLQSSLQAAEHPAHLLDDILVWDAELKSAAINPGTSADLTVATLFVDRLQTILPSARNND